MAKIIGVKFKNTSKIYYFAPANEKDEYEKDSGVIVETAKGLEYGMVVFGVKEVSEENIVQPLKPVLRKATEKDLNVIAENEKKIPDVMKETEEKIENSIYELRKKFGNSSISRASAEKE